MKPIIHLFLPFLFIIGLSFNSFAAIATPDKMAKDKTKEESIFEQLSAEEIFTMSRKDIETKIGRKLKFKEKLGLFVMQKVAKKAAKKRTKKTRHKNLMGILSFTSGLLGPAFITLGAITVIGYTGAVFIIVLGFILSAAAIVLGIISRVKKEPKRFLSTWGLIFGWAMYLLLFMLLMWTASENL